MKEFKKLKYKIGKKVLFKGKEDEIIGYQNDCEYYGYPEPYVLKSVDRKTNWHHTSSEENIVITK